MMQLKEVFTRIEKHTELHSYIEQIPAKYKKTQKAYLAALVKLSYLLYITQNNQKPQVKKILDELSQIPFEENYDYWTWVEHAVVLQARIAREEEQQAVYKQFMQLIEDALNTGEEAVVKIKHNVQDRFVKGETLSTQTIDAAIKKNDLLMECEQRILYVMKLFKIKELGAQPPYTDEKLEQEMEQYMKRINEIVEQVGIEKVEPFK
ncbi:DUF6707 family protein [Paenibacillus nicotianae]